MPPPTRSASIATSKRTDILLLVSLALSVFCLSFSTAQTPLRIGLADNYPPLSDTSSGETQGYLVDLVKKLEPHLESPVQIVASDWQSLETQIQTGEIDALLGLYYTPERAKIYNFGPEIFRNRVHFYFKEDAQILSPQDAAGQRVAVAGESSYLRTFAESKYPKFEWVVFPDFPSAIAGLQNDPSIVALFEEEAIVDSALTKDPSLKLEERGGPQLERSLQPVSRLDRPEITQQITAALRQISPSTLRQIRASWLHETDSSANAAPVAKASDTLELTTREKAFLEKHPSIRFASDPNWPPLSFIGENGQFQGIQHDILDLIQKRSGLSIEKPIFKDWPEVRTAVDEGRADLRSGSSDEQRSTIPYLTLPLALAATSADAKQHIAYLSFYSGKRISINSGNSYSTELAKRFPDIEFITVEEDHEGLKKIVEGDVQGHIGNYAVCTYLAQRHFASNIVVLDIMSERQTLSFVSGDIPDSEQLIVILNKAIDSITEDELNSIFDRWIKANVQQVTDFSDWWKPLAMLALCLFLAVLWKVNNLRLKRALMQANERSLLASKAGAGGQFEWFPKSQKVTYSPEFFETLGYSPTDFPQSEQTMVKLMHPDDLRPALARQLVYTRQGKEYQHKSRMRRCDGTWAWIVMRGIPTHFHKDGSTKRYIGVQMDVTELQVAIEKQREQQEVAKQASRAKSDFLANMSHEIRTPMNAILGFSRLLKRDSSLNIKQSEYVHLINTSSEHLLSLLDDILDMAKIESRQMSLLQLKVNLPQLIADIADIFKARCDERGIAFVAQISEELPAYVLGDGTKIRQIVFNLMVNAVKFTERGQISLSANIVDGLLSIRIADTGCGIPQEEIPKLFKAFSQGESGQHQSQGTGLGLAISREFCRLMGGDIAVESEQGHGSTFTVTLPFETIEASPEEEVTENINIPYQAAAAKSLLVVDDKLANLQYMERFLSEYGFKIRLAHNGEIAIAQWKLYSPDLILLDIRMPKVDGYQVVERIRKDTIFHQPKIIALTASAFNEQRQRILDLGADSFITKPFNENALLKQIAQLLDLPTTQSPDPKTSPVSLPPFQSDQTINLSERQKLELINACDGGYLEKIEGIITEIEVDQPCAAERLRTLARNFDYEQIAGIAEKASGHSAAPETNN